MSNHIKREIRASALLTINQVWPAIAQHCGGGEIMSMELSDAPEHAQLDMKAGIDLFQITQRGATGLAARCQHVNGNYQTFTVRRIRNRLSRKEMLSRGFLEDEESGCEFQKRLEAIQSGGRFVYPYWTSHAYFTDGILQRAAVAKTVDIYEAILARARGASNGVWLNTCPEGNGINTHFFVVPWSSLDSFVCHAAPSLPCAQISMFGGSAL